MTVMELQAALAQLDPRTQVQIVTIRERGWRGPDARTYGEIDRVEVLPATVQIIVKEK